MHTSFCWQELGSAKLDKTECTRTRHHFRLGRQIRVHISWSLLAKEPYWSWVEPIYLCWTHTNVNSITNSPLAQTGYLASRKTCGLQQLATKKDGVATIELLLTVVSLFYVCLNRKNIKHSNSRLHTSFCLQELGLQKLVYSQYNNILVSIRGANTSAYHWAVM